MSLNFRSGENKRQNQMILYYDGNLWRAHSHTGQTLAMEITNVYICVYQRKN